jgi:hypothetical protein
MARISHNHHSKTTYQFRTETRAVRYDPSEYFTKTVAAMVTDGRFVIEYKNHD